ncbi:MAG: serine hydrolase, partial [Saprospiraceae bacterium]|nr:serine hydrolase [Saprospiraceae bacterium]
LLPACADKMSSQNESSYHQGIDRSVIDSIHHDILDGDYGLIDHFLLMRNGEIVADYHYDQDYETIAKEYDTTHHQYNYDHPAWHPYYQNTNLHSLQSVGKSITSLLLGIAVDEDVIRDLDAPILPLFVDYEVDRDDQLKNAITIRHLLTMQTGIQWDESSSYADDTRNNCIVMELSNDWIKYVLNRPMDTLPGTKFVYNSGATVLLGKIVGMATGKRIDECAEEKLFGPLGITEYYWKVTPGGEIDTEGGLYLSTHDLAKIGTLVLQRGQWEGKQIVSQEWLAASFNPAVQFDEERGYGYQWWLPLLEDGSAKIMAGNGYGGQYLMLVPDYQMIVVFNGWNIHERPEKSSWSVLQERILPNTRLSSD